jgi:hypothetical protein
LALTKFSGHFGTLSIAALLVSCSGGGAETGISSSSVTLAKTPTTFAEYVVAYPDLAAAFVKTGNGQTPEAWGKTHYCKFGKAEGRQFAGTVDCGSTSSEGNSSGGAQEYSGYVDKYPDLLAAYNAYVAAGGAMSKSAWGLRHYTTAGQNEGRTPPSGSTPVVDQYAAYVDKYPDLLAAYNAYVAAGGTMSKSAWGLQHWTNAGQKEGRSVTKQNDAGSNNSGGDSGGGDSGGGDSGGGDSGGGDSGGGDSGGGSDNSSGSGGSDNSSGSGGSDNGS